MAEESSVNLGLSSNSLSITDKEVSSITINSKEVQSITNHTNRNVLYNKVKYMKITYTGDTVTSGYIYGDEELKVDYGDGTVETYNDGYMYLDHTYSDEDTHTIKIYGATALDASCFYECTGLTSIELPNGIESIGDNCFESCTNLTELNIPKSVGYIGGLCWYNSSITKVILNWDYVNEILEYDSSWGNDSVLYIVPNHGNTLSMYVAKSYPNTRTILQGTNIIDQKELVTTYGTSSQVMVMLAGLSGGKYYTRIYSWYPVYKHSNQKGTIYFECTANSSYTKTTSNKTLSGNYADVSNVSTQASYLNSGMVRVTIPSYYDSANNNYYTGVMYEVSFNNIKHSTSYYMDVTYL